MKKIRIHLSQPFEEILAAVLSLPRAHAPASAQASAEDEELKQVLRGLYEAANGRHVETTLGLVPIAPPVAPFLKELPFEVATQLDFLVEAMSRVITCPSKLTYAAGASDIIAFDNGRFAPAASNLAVKEEELFSRFILQTYRSHLSPEKVSHGCTTDPNHDTSPHPQRRAAPVCARQARSTDSFRE
ncbi:MAG TPA: hypothetical protein VG095_05015 [Chthoniobacterales bacterium]|nr:hypothetical protein [Chthoniobacterales bacterium]